MLINSYSKINLSLTVNKKSKFHKLHEIQTIYCLTSLFDKIRIKKIKRKKDVIKFVGRFARYVNQKDNSIKKTLKILRKNGDISNYYSILVNKEIPVFGGLGGGTSNAFSVLKYLNIKQLDKNLSKILFNKVGSDLKLFTYDQGILFNFNKIVKLPKKHKLFFLLVFPYIKCSTKEIYSKVKNYSPKLRYNLFKTHKKEDFIKLLKNQDNDLQEIVVKKYPVIKKIISRIKQSNGCYFSRITGSGSVCYGVFKSEKTANAALNAIKLKNPKYWYSVAKTI